MPLNLIVVLATFLIGGTLILCRLRTIQQTQLVHSQWLQELFHNRENPKSYRKMFQSDGECPTVLHPAMLLPYLSVMSVDQNHRYRKWLLAESHERFSVEEVCELEGILSSIPEM